jgi:uncharacterized oligopeptide transporter (OPT) family protein
LHNNLLDEGATLWALIAACLAVTVVNVVAVWCIEHYRLRLLRKLIDSIAKLYDSLEILERERRFIDVAADLMERALKDSEEGGEE